MYPQCTRQKGNLAAILLLFLYFLSFFLPPSLNRKRIFKMNSPLPWAYPLPSKNIHNVGGEEMNTGLWDLWEGRDQKKNLRTSLGPNTSRKGRPTSGMQPEQGSRLESGAGWDFSPHTPQPGALVQEMTCTDLREALGRFAYRSSIRQSELK